MAHRTEEDEDVPNAVEIAAVIVGKEISAACVENAFCQNPKQRRQRHLAHHGLRDKDNRPTHGEIQRK